jgi:hypothetical protein
MTPQPLSRALVRAHVVRFVRTLSLLALVSATATAAPHAEPIAVTSNIRVAPVLAPVFDELVQSSATFREQCDRIARASYVRVIVSAVMAQSTISRGSARTTMRRYAAGALIATVEIPVPLTMGEYAEFFGHEFEHILEQIDRVNLEQQTTTGAAQRLADGSFETRRARRVGQAIAIETERPAAGRPASEHAVPPVGTSGALRQDAHVTALKRQ